MTVIGTNIGAIRAANASTAAQAMLGRAIDRLSTGKRILERAQRELARRLRSVSSADFLIWHTRAAVMPSTRPISSRFISSI